MRRRIVIGLLAVVMIGVGAFFFSQPKEGSVEWHKREYFKAREVGLIGLAQEFASTRPRGRDWSDEDQEKMKFHERALINAGYLEERTLLVSNAAPGNVVTAMYGTAIAAAGGNSECVSFEIAGTNLVRVVTVKSTTGPQMSQWEALIRKADVPDTAK